MGFNASQAPLQLRGLAHNLFFKQGNQMSRTTNWWLFLITLTCATSAQAEQLQARFDDIGRLQSLRHAGQEVLAGPSSPSVELRTPDGATARHSLKKGDGQRLDDRYVHAYDGLTVTTRVWSADDRLRLDITYQNTGDTALRQIRYQPTAMRFPRRPKGNRWM